MSTFFFSPFFFYRSLAWQKKPWIFYIGIIHWYNTISLNWYGGSWDIYGVDSEPFLWDSFFKPKVPWDRVVFVAALFISGSSKKRSQKVNLPVVVFFFFSRFFNFFMVINCIGTSCFCLFVHFMCSHVQTWVHIVKFTWIPNMIV